MSVLEGKCGYLSGPIQFDDSPANWRTEVKHVLAEEFKIDLFNPYDDPKQQFVPELNAAIEAEDYDTVARIAKGFVWKDLCMVDHSNFVIAYLPYKVPTAGVHHEIITADKAKRPTLLVCPQGKKRIPAWYFGFIDHKKYMFGGWDQLYQYLREVNDYKHTDDFRWAYVYGLI